MYEFKLYPVPDFFVIPSLYYCSVVHMSDRSGFNQQTVIRFVIRIQKAFKWAINCNWKLHWMPLAFWKQFSQLISCSFNFADLWHFWWSGFFYAFSKKKLMQSNVVLHVVMLTIHLCIKAGTNSQEKMEIDKIWSCFIFMGNRISTISISPIFFWQSLAAVLACLWHSGKHTHPILSRKLLSFKWDHSHPDLACRLGVVAKLSGLGSP